jgi:predicted small metal-binding protein
MNMKRRILRCHEVTIGANKGCNYEIEGNTGEELYRKMIDHARKEHDLRREDLTSQLEEQIRSLISLDKNGTAE